MKRILITQYGGCLDNYSRLMVLEIPDSVDLHDISDLDIEFEAEAASIPWEFNEDEGVQSSHFDIEDDDIAPSDYPDVPTIRINPEALE